VSYIISPVYLLPALRDLLGRPVEVFDAALAIMKDNLEPMLTALGFPTKDLPKAYFYAGELMPDPNAVDRWPCILAGGPVRTEELGTGQEDDVNLAITCAWPTQITREQFRAAMDVASVARGIMRYPRFAGPLADPADPSRRIWNHCLASGFRAVPAGFPYYSGYVCEFTVIQTPGGNLWKFPTP
jgi:hypothetical protein